MSWLMIGDFNEVLCVDDKFGGNQININQFVLWINLEGNKLILIELWNLKLV